MSLAELAQQLPAVALLQRSLERGRLGHAYLFTGDQLDLLEQTARALAKTLNCRQPPSRAASGAPLDFCGHCPACHRIDGDTHADVHWVRPESKLRLIVIDQIVPRSGSNHRPVTDLIQMKPTEGNYKVAVLVAADRMKQEAANAFLKTLEEPPAQSVMILLSTEPQRVLETIVSRCLRLNIGGESGQPQQAEPGWLRSFSELATTSADGLLGRYRLLDALLGQFSKLREGIETELTARSPLERYDDAEPALREQWEDELVAAIEAEYRRQRAELLAALQWWLRDVWLQTLKSGMPTLSFPNLATASGKVAAKLSAAQALENLRVLERTQWLLGSNVQEALAMEVGLLKLNL